MKGVKMVGDSILPFLNSIIKKNETNQRIKQIVFFGCIARI